MQITADAVKALREETGAGIMDCKRALTETEGDVPKAKAILREKGLAKATSLQSGDRATSQGLVYAYVHGGRIGSLVEVNCETDFVANTDEFKNLVREVAMHVAAMDPRYVSKDEVPVELIQREQLSEQEVANMALLSQPYVRDQSKTVEQLITEIVAKTRETIRVRRFARFELGK
jgi:elongation factor Ts